MLFISFFKMLSQGCRGVAMENLRISYAENRMISSQQEDADCVIPTEFAL